MTRSASGERVVAMQRDEISYPYPLEADYLINPAHRDYRLIKIEGPIDYVMDERLG